MEGRAFLPSGERVVEFGFTWEAGGRAREVGLQREVGSPAFYRVTSLDEPARASSREELARTNGANAFLGREGTTASLHEIRDRLGAEFSQKGNTAVAGRRHLLLERSGPGGPRVARWIDGKAVAYARGPLSCDVVADREDAVCLCLSP
jgi:hypothetical protein